MMDFLLAAENGYFFVALIVMSVIALVQGVGLISGLDASGPIDNLIPDVDVDGASGATDWLQLGKIPFLIILTLLLAIFSMTGLTLQLSSNIFTGSLMTGWIAALMATVLSLPIAQIVLRRIVPVFAEDTTAVSRDSFVGLSATIVVGTAKKGQPAQAKLQDQHGQTHYIMVAPWEDDVSFSTGDTVAILEMQGNVYLAGSL